MKDPTSNHGLAGIHDLNTLDGCIAYGRWAQLGSDQELNIACGIRAARRAEQLANEAREQIRAIERQRQEARNTCEQLAARAREMQQAMFTPKWDQLGGDTEWTSIESEFKALNCAQVLGLE